MAVNLIKLTRYQVIAVLSFPNPKIVIESKSILRFLGLPRLLLLAAEQLNRIRLFQCRLSLKSDVVVGLERVQETDDVAGKIS